MLYSPKWEQETKADLFKLETLIAWLEKQPADKEYQYLSPTGCLLAQYFSAQGFKNVGCAAVYFNYDNRRLWLWRRRMRGYFDPSWNLLAQNGPYTFGAALARARKLQASS